MGVHVRVCSLQQRGEDERAGRRRIPLVMVSPPRVHLLMMACVGVMMRHFRRSRLRIWMRVHVWQVRALCEAQQVCPDPRRITLRLVCSCLRLSLSTPTPSVRVVVVVQATDGGLPRRPTMGFVVRSAACSSACDCLAPSLGRPAPTSDDGADAPVVGMAIDDAAAYGILESFQCKYALVLSVVDLALQVRRRLVTAHRRCLSPSTSPQSVHKSYALYTTCTHAACEKQPTPWAA
jgi:hypothetical protein